MGGGWVGVGRWRVCRDGWMGDGGWVGVCGWMDGWVGGVWVGVSGWMEGG